jgi:GNAT superfamily N-acetyltransferase
MTELHPTERPAIDGLRFRTYAGPDDLTGIVEAANAALRADGVTDRWTVDQMGLEVEKATHADPRQDVLLATVDERVVAAVRLEWSDATDGDRHYWSLGYVDPEWRRRRIGTALLELGEARRRRIAADHDIEAPKRLVTWTDDGDLGGAALMAGHGYERLRVYHHMVRPDLDDILEPPMPAGLEIRPVTPDLLRPVFDGMMEAFRDHPGGHDESPQAFDRWREEPEFDIDLLVVAFDGDEVAGGVQVGIYPDENRANGYRRGWADPVFTRRAWRRRGLASALLGRALVRMRDRGMTSAQLDVDAQNPNEALTLYERHGFRPDRSTTQWHKPLR